MRRLIINADDFGLTAGVNRAILKAHEQGVVTSATLMANGASFDEAAAMAGGAPALSVGCHVVLVDGFPALPPNEVPTLVDPVTGAFPRTFTDLVGAIRRFSEKEVEAEVAAQIRKLQGAGIAVSHVDTHKHAHVFPQVLAPLLRAASSRGVAAIRAPFEPVGFSNLIAQPRLLKRTLAAWSFHRYARSFRRRVDAAGVRAPDGCLGIVATGSLDQKLFDAIMRHMPEGIWELVCHPGYVDADLRATPTRLLESRARELEVLTSTAARSALQNNQIELTSFHAFTK